MRPYALNITNKDANRYVYRIVSLERFFQLFSNKTNVLVAPQLWDDPWENCILKWPIFSEDGQQVYRYDQVIYGQCWTLTSASDAMWRLYSPDGKGVRIRTKIRQLIKLLEQPRNDTKAVATAIGRMEYVSAQKLNEIREKPFSSDVPQLREMFGALLKKRKAFKHEAELRILCMTEYDQKDFELDLSPTTVCFNFEPSEVIDQVMLHPSLDGELVETMKNAIHKVTGIPRAKIHRSVLYDPPKRLVRTPSNSPIRS